MILGQEFSSRRVSGFVLANPGRPRLGRVGEWLKPADCKSAAPCGLRRFESFPVHQALVVGIAENRRAIACAMFESGPIRGASAAQEKCAAKDEFGAGNGLGLGS